jgi:carbon monoxide dehydrogenase subunit G
MRRVERTVRLAAPAAEIYAFLTEPANVPKWQTGVTSSVRTSPPPTVAGSTGRITMEVMGQRIAADTKILEAVPDRRLVIATSASGMSVTGSLDLAEVEGGTQLTFRSEIKADNIFMAPLEGIVADTAERDVDASLARLSAAVTAGPAKPAD